jgi:hypothetical protein
MGNQRNTHQPETVANFSKEGQLATRPKSARNLCTAITLHNPVTFVLKGQSSQVWLILVAKSTTKHRLG